MHTATVKLYLEHQVVCIEYMTHIGFYFLSVLPLACHQPFLTSPNASVLFNLQPSKCYKFHMDINRIGALIVFLLAGWDGMNARWGGLLPVNYTQLMTHTKVNIVWPGELKISTLSTRYWLFENCTQYSGHTCRVEVIYCTYIYLIAFLWSIKCRHS